VMFCSELVLSFSCVYFVVTGHFIPVWSLSILRAYLASTVKSAAGKVGLTLPRCLGTPDLQGSRPATRGGAIGQLPSPKFSQTYVFVRRSNKLHHFASPPKISVGCAPAGKY